MGSTSKKLSIAFYWHMHQPVYQLSPDGDSLMPWVRLHAVKDYLDMALMVNDFKRLKLNFNIVPVLLDSLIEYGEKGYHDIHSRLTVTSISDLTDDDKRFILNNFFDANYQTMIFQHEEYNRLYQKRFSSDDIDIEDFTDQEFSDIMAWFNLVWIDPSHRKHPKLHALFEKGFCFTRDDRIQIIELQREIIRKIIPTFKKLVEKNKIEITTSPYYHPILPILMDIKTAQKNVVTSDTLPECLNMSDDAKNQTKMALDRVEELFGKRPQGIWPSEHCISPQTLDMFKELGLKWTISDEGILSNSINTDFVRDFKGYLEDPYKLMKPYSYKTKNSNLDIIFRDSALPNLISFEYPNHDAKTAAEDLYDRIKVIQNKLVTSPDEHHLLTIAMDGENCWESYKDDGSTFLKKIYTMLEEDETLDTVLISEYLQQDKTHKNLPKIYSGSWINRDFQLWIGEPVKNLAWTYLEHVRQDFEKFSKLYPTHKNLEIAKKEMYIAEGSDWFWWYGEPNDSGQDDVFDFLFREHLKNIYRLLELDVPKELDTPLIAIFSKPSRYPKGIIQPTICGYDNDEQWQNAGSISMPDGPVLQENKLFDKMCFGFDEKNFYLRLYMNNYSKENINKSNTIYQLYLYTRNAHRKQSTSPIRLINKTDNIFPIIREKFHNELQLCISDNTLYPPRLAKAMTGGLWTIKNEKDIEIAYKDFVDLKIPFESLDIASGEIMEFFFINASFGIKDSFIPKDVLLTIQRP